MEQPCCSSGEIKFECDEKNQAKPTALPFPNVINVMSLARSSSYQCPNDAKEDPVKKILEQMAITNNVIVSVDRYLSDKESTPDAFFLYGLSEAISVAILTLRAATLSVMENEIRSAGSEKNVDVAKGLEDFKKTFDRLEKVGKRLQKIAISLPPGQITESD